MSDEAEKIESLRRDVRRALSEAGLSPIPYARETLGKGRDFVNDFLTDKKSKLPREVLDDLANRAGYLSWSAFEAGERSTLADLESSGLLTKASSLAAKAAAIKPQAPDQIPDDPLEAYVTVEVLPTYAGMGGGGTGDGDRHTTLLSRRLVEDELGVRASDVLLINVRGNSMEPLFFHGDQLLIDRRDTSPTQPGPFALRHGDEYVVKNVRWIDKRTRLRVWSQNEAVGGEEYYEPDEVEFIGRPVWFARRL